MKVNLWLVAFMMIGCSNGLSQETIPSQARLIGGPCEGCEAVFEYGERELSSEVTLPGADQPGPKLTVSGTIYQKDGKTPAQGVILYIYHTDREGVYPTRGEEKDWSRRHGFIRGWMKTGADGRYTFHTLIPATYPNRQAAAHIHPTVLEPDGKYYYLADYLFADDPLLKHANLDRPQRGGKGVLTPTKVGDRQVAERDLVLGKNVPGYP